MKGRRAVPETTELDPVRRDPDYWERFHARVLSAAEPELERRRRVALTVADVVHSWSRLLVPLAAAAAAWAGMFLMGNGTGTDGSATAHAPLGLEAIVLPLELDEDPPGAFLLAEVELDREVVLHFLEEVDPGHFPPQ
jgi:hypothetical protein